MRILTNKNDGHRFGGLGWSALEKRKKRVIVFIYLKAKHNKQPLLGVYASDVASYLKVLGLNFR